MNKNRFLQLLVFMTAILLAVLAFPRSVSAYPANSVSGKISGSYKASELKDDAKLEMTGNVTITLDCKKQIKSITNGKSNLTLKIMSPGVAANRKLTVKYRGSGGTMNGINLDITTDLILDGAYVVVDAKTKGVICRKLQVKNSQLFVEAKNNNGIRALSMDVYNSTVHSLSQEGTPFDISGDINCEYADIKANMQHASPKRSGIYSAQGDINIKKGCRVWSYGSNNAINAEIGSIYIAGKVEAYSGWGPAIIADHSYNGLIKIQGNADVYAESADRSAILAGTALRITGGKVKAKGGRYGLDADGGFININGNVTVEATGTSNTGIYATDGINIVKAYSVRGTGKSYSFRTGKSGTIKLGTGMSITSPKNGIIWSLNDGSRFVATKTGGVVASYRTATDAEITYSKLDGTLKFTNGEYAGEHFQVNFSGNGGDHTFTWQVSSNKVTWTNRSKKSGTVISSYGTSSSDAGLYLRVVVTGTGLSGSITSPEVLIKPSYAIINTDTTIVPTWVVGTLYETYVKASYVSSYEWRVASGPSPSYNNISWETVKKHAEVSGEKTRTVTIRPTDTWLNGCYIYCVLTSSTRGYKNITAYKKITVKTAPAPTVTPTPVPATPTPTPAPTPAADGTTFEDSKGVTYTSITTDSSDPKVAYKKPAMDAHGEIAIPATVTYGGVKYRVTWLAAEAFKNNKKLTKITIGKDVTTVGKSAFEGCSNLKTVNLGASVSEIRALAFYKCTSLTAITIKEKVKIIGASAFATCKKLQNVTFKTKLLTADSVGDKAFRNTHAKMKVKVPKEKLSAYKKLLLARGVAKTATFTGIDVE